jgi:hypothetical protein
MYGSYGMYSGNMSNFSSSSNLYKPAGVVNCNTISNNTHYATNLNPSLYRTNDGSISSFPTVNNSSITNPIAQHNTVSFAQYTDVSFGSQHTDYQQNPAPVNISVRQTQTNPIPAIYVDNNGQVGKYVEQYNNGTNQLSTNSNPPTTVQNPQTLVQINTP